MPIGICFKLDWNITDKHTKQCMYICLFAFNPLLIFLFTELFWFHMLLQLLFISAVAMATVVTSNLCPSFPPFYSDHDYALVNHTIQTLSVVKPDCMAVCQETLTCFSINIYRHQTDGTWMCDLNRSNKRQKPESFVAKTGYEYAEPKVRLALFSTALNLHLVFYYFYSFIEHEVLRQRRLCPERW